MEESTDYTGFVYQFGGKTRNACQEACSVSVSGGGQACINGHPFGLGWKKVVTT